MSQLILNLLLGWGGAAAVNYLADVLPIHRKLIPASCPACGEKLGWGYYLLLKPCDRCRKRPLPRHLALLVIGPLLAGLSYYFPLGNLGNYGGLLWLVFFELVVVIDIEHRLILHPVSLVGAVLGLLFGTITHGLVDTLIGGGAGFAIMFFFYLVGDVFVRMLSRSRGEEIDEVALGFGDVNLAGISGLILGWPGIIGGLFAAIFLGGIVSGIFLVVQKIRKKYEAYQALPYGPFLVFSVLFLLILARFSS
jgi:leader peptidase (prepilin peptidase)/N-methyltransferase